MSDENIFKGLNTICTHVGQVKDEQYGGSVSPIILEHHMNILIKKLIDIQDIAQLQIRNF